MGTRVLTISGAGTRTRLALGLAVVAVVVASVLVWRLGATEEAPYTDPASTGGLTLCSADGKAVTEGRTGDRPFADLVLGDTPLPDDADPAGAVATLYAYQPREGIAPGEFSGSPITAAVAFADASRPATRVTADAWSLGDFVTAFPASLQGYVQLRLVLGTPQLGTLADGYDTADIKVDGDRWELVRGGSASCRDAASAVADGS